MTDFLRISDQVTSNRKRSSSSPFSDDDDGGGVTSGIGWKKRRYFSPQLEIEADGDFIMCPSRTTAEEQEDGKNKIATGHNRPFFPLASSVVTHDLKIRPSFDAPLKRVATKRMLEKKKLVLVLDLDNTLLHSVILPSGADRQKRVTEVEAGGFHTLVFGKDGEGPVQTMQTKLRPLLLSFLKMVSPMYEMIIYTHGNFQYATKIKEILDPDGIYFKNKVFTREDSVRMGSEKVKHMDLVMVETNMIVVIDDKPSKWVDHPGNVIHIKKYEHDFHPTLVNDKDCGGDRDNDKGDDILLHVYLVLHKIYSDFYDSSEYGRSSDVREVMRKIRRETLKDCKIIIIIVNDGECSNNNCSKQSRSLMSLVKMMGGFCCKEISDEVTHVVVVGSPDLKNDQDVVVMNWAVENGKFVVTKDWLDSAYYTWTKPQEKNFLFFCSYSPILPPLALLDC